VVGIILWATGSQGSTVIAAQGNVWVPGAAELPLRYPGPYPDRDLTNCCYWWAYQVKLDPPQS
jgi:hypothetical protein